MDSEEKHVLQKWVSVGDIVTLLVSLAVFAYGYGRLSADVSTLARDINTLQGREITPGAAQKIAAIEAQVQAVERAHAEAARMASEDRRDILNRLDRMEAKLDAHMEK
jgi:acyl-CoA reductase-like NAD-dependent aldehyde dehydrogenase